MIWDKKKRSEKRKIITNKKKPGRDWTNIKTHRRGTFIYMGDLIRDPMRLVRETANGNFGSSLKC